MSKAFEKYKKDLKLKTQKQLLNLVQVLMRERSSPAYPELTDNDVASIFELSHLVGAAETVKVVAKVTPYEYGYERARNCTVTRRHVPGKSNNVISKIHGGISGINSYHSGHHIAKAISTNMVAKKGKIIHDLMPKKTQFQTIIANTLEMATYFPPSSFTDDEQDINSAVVSIAKKCRTMEKGKRDKLVSAFSKSVPSKCGAGMTDNGFGLATSPIKINDEITFSRAQGTVLALSQVAGNVNSGLGHYAQCHFDHGADIVGPVRRLQDQVTDVCYHNICYVSATSLDLVRGVYNKLRAKYDSDTRVVVMYEGNFVVNISEIVDMSGTQIKILKDAIFSCTAVSARKMFPECHYVSFKSPPPKVSKGSAGDMEVYRATNARLDTARQFGSFQLYCNFRYFNKPMYEALYEGRDEYEMEGKKDKEELKFFTRASCQVRKGYVMMVSKGDSQPFPDVMSYTVAGVQHAVTAIWRQNPYCMDTDMVEQCIYDYSVESTKTVEFTVDIVQSFKPQKMDFGDDADDRVSSTSKKEKEKEEEEEEDNTNPPLAFHFNDLDEEADD